MGRPGKHSVEFKAEAVELVLTSGRTQVDIAASLGINKNTLNGWVVAAREADQPSVLDVDERAELARLRKENRDLRQDRDILRKAAAYFARGDDPVTGYLFVQDNQAVFDVTRMCGLLGVSRSGFYGWQDRPLSDRGLANAYLANEIHTIFTASRCTYGAPRVLGQLRNNNVRCARGRVARIMRENGWVGAHSRRKWRQGNKPKAPAPDLLDRDFTAESSDEKWVADITEFHCLDGKLFLAGIVDLHDKTIVGWSMGQRQTTDLVVNALVMALTRREPDQVVHHSDHGSQYTSLEFSNRMAAWKLTPSFGSVGDCYDNAKIESVWSVIKRELKVTVGPWEHLTRSQLRTALFDYIEVFYNRQRHQEGLNHQTPEQAYNQSNKAA